MFIAEAENEQFTKIVDELVMSAESDSELAEGLKWRQEETWFGARVDPEFARKRGSSSASTPPRQRAA